MQVYGMRWIGIDSVIEAKMALTQIGSDPGGIAHMAGKGLGRAIKLEQVPLRVAHILKQEMLSVGGDAAVHRDVITNNVEATDVMLLGTVRQLERLASKVLAQPFGLKKVGHALKQLLSAIEPAKTRILDCRGKQLELGKRTLVMGILNVTPDSFSDGGKYIGVEDAVSQAERLVEEGADILDIGGESTRPNHSEVSAEEEWGRLEPVLKMLLYKISVPISIDTYKASVAAKALEAGAHLINDVWGLQKDRDMARVVGEYKAPVIVMHNQKGTDYHHLMGDILGFLQRSIELAEAQGLTGDQIIIDPGIGFGKTTEQNLEVMARLAEFKSLGHPVLLGTSRKSMIGNTLNLPVDERLEGTLATSVLGVAAQVDIIRVHDVKANYRAIKMADAIVREKRGIHYDGA
ncbi:dihydropteroate synthase [Desulfosporosinus orientis DSM 765]|uniref:Dihydropteroate synthase n=1 Tax=Desulfosporosinus orientis (strain ATCC 19365 / DSM 765 / NCIMB 8382 / VKM B-1628 / Singapore I) TaxID=768706 RepID=G7W4W7_DESOD|nr:dihydropteroate synthase [Desulfosporosinus orientis]AET65839.1 dihydropteroate synthase [Desulfosporosinus orientis DSM 765]